MKDIKLSYPYSTLKIKMKWCFLTGFTEDRKALWRETCMMLRSQLTDPYLRAMFAFLTDDADSFDPVLVSNNVVVLGYAKYITEIC